MSLADRLNTTATLQRQTPGKDAAGGKTLSWSNVTGQVDVPADLQPAGSGVKLRYAHRQMDCQWQLYTAQDLGARATDRVVIGARTFKVLGYQPPPPGYPAGDWPAVCDLEEQLL